MKRILVIPAAGRGSRLAWNGPKALVPVAGRPMLAHVFERHAPFIDRFVVVAAPAAVNDIQRFLESVSVPTDVTVQDVPNGMLPAVLRAQASIERHRPEQVWITWCDQIGISDGTVRSLAEQMDDHPEAAVAFPTVQQAPPYVHYARNDAGRIVGVLQRRDGDVMPTIGESDAGLFALSLRTFLDDLAFYDRHVALESRSGERNFLPFIPWMAARGEVRTFPLADPREAVGVNTPQDLDSLERYLRGV